MMREVFCFLQLRATFRTVRDHLRSRRCWSIVLLTAIALLNSCDDGSSSSERTDPPRPAPDFSISIDKTSFSVIQGDSTTLTVSISGANDFNWPVSTSLKGLPSTVVASPSAFKVTPGSSQRVTLTASATAATGAAKLTVTGMSGSLIHSVNCNLKIVIPAQGAYAPFRLRYLDMAQEIPGNAGQFPTSHLLYHWPTKRFFSADAYQNRIWVYDARTELQVGKITVPGAWTIDQSPDQSTLYVGTQVGDIYKINPVTMTVTESIPSRQIGPAGYPTYEVHPLADGRLALLGDQLSDKLTGFSYGSIAIWNPTDNSLTEYATQFTSARTPPTSAPICGPLANISFLSVTPDRTKLMLGSNATDQTICQFDPTTAQYLTAGIEGRYLLQPPDGQEFLIIGDYTDVSVYSASTMQLLDKFPAPNKVNGGPPTYALSLDGNTLYANQTGVVVAYNWRTHTQLGWTSSPRRAGYFFDFVPLAVDETGLIAGLVGHGIAFVDGAALQPNARPRERRENLLRPSARH